MGRVVVNLLGLQNEEEIGKWHQLEDDGSDNISEVSQTSSIRLTLPLAVKLKRKLSSIRKKKMES